MPSTLSAPKTYRLTLTGDETYTKDFENTNGTLTSLSITDVKIGTYSVTVDGYDGSMKTMTGTSTTNLSVTPSGTNSCTVDMEAINTEGTGSITVTFDWTDVSTSVTAMKDALAKGAISFDLMMDHTGAFVSQGKKTAEKTSTKQSFTWSDIPSSTGTVSAYFVVRDSEDYILCGNFLSMNVQVYAGQTSVPDANETLTDGAYVLSSAYLSNAKNVYDVAYDYTGVQDPSTSVRITWKNQMSRSGSNLFSSVNVIYAPEGGEETTVSVPQDANSEDGSTIITGMTSGTAYTIKTQAVTTTGKRSPVVTSLTGVYAKNLVTSVAITGTVPSTMKHGETITLGATVNPENATFKGYTWSVSDANVLHIAGDTFTAYKPGMATITLTSSDDTTKTSTTDTIAVMLSTPDNVTATPEPNDVLVSWSSVPFAESYTILKSTNGGAYAELATVSDGFSYLDTAIVTDSSYTYEVIANAEILKDGSFDPKSDASSATETIMPVQPTVTINAATIKNQTITVSQPEEMVILPTTTTLTVSLESAIEGATSYIWSVNDTVVKQGSYAEASFIGLTAATTGILEDAVGGQNNLKLSVVIDGITYSATTLFGVIDVLDTGVTVSVPSNVLRLPTTQGSVQISSTVIPGNATRQDVTYTSSDEAIATVSSTGLVTINTYGDVTITIAPAYGTPSTLTFDFYKPTFYTALEVLNAVNGISRTFITNADTQFGGDWWQGETALHYYYPDKTNATIDIKSSENASQSAGYLKYNGYSEVLPSLGSVVLTTTNDVSAWSYKHSWKGYLETNELQTIGYNNTGDLQVTLPYNQGTATIHYNGINVYGTDRGGTYNVTFDKSVGTDGYNPIKASTDIIDSASVTRLFN